METIVDTTVRDTIQIDASKISLLNPEWAPAIQECIETQVWKGLGCVPFVSPPRCELYKLLLYKPGAHFSPHKDTEKAPGMFATFIVVLPSEFSGGEIHASHGDSNMVLDSAKNSAFGTTSLAWYADVTHEVKQITSGYRLALSYHLINTSPGTSPPYLPSDDSCLQHLREIFSRWLDGKDYPRFGVNEAVAYVFTHKYTSVSLKEAALKGFDQRVASFFEHLDVEGILVLMGWINVHIEGVSSDHGPYYFEGEGSAPEYGCDNGEAMSYVNETTVWVDDLRDMKGKKIRITKIDVDDDKVLPYKVFRGVEPDESKVYGGSLGNEGATMEFMYKRAGLLIIPKCKQLPLMLSSEGPIWALEELEKSKSEGPSKENRIIIDFLARQEGRGIQPSLLKVAVEWNNADLWGRIIELNPELFFSGGFPDSWKDWEAFGFDDVRPTLEKLFQQPGRLSPRGVEFLMFVKTGLPFGEDPQKDEWISAQATRVMETFITDCDKVETCVMDMVRWKGLRFASSTVLPRFLVKPSVATALAIELMKYRAELIALPREVEEHPTSNADLFDHILDKIIEAVISPASARYHKNLEDGVSSLLLAFIPAKGIGYYGKLLDNLLSNPRKEPFYVQYHKLYAKIIPGMVNQLGEHNINISSSPSREFFYNIIGTYLQEILGSKEGSPYLKFSALTCGHEDCANINGFLQSEKTSIVIEETKWEAVKDCVENLKIDGRFSLLKSDRYSRYPSVKLIKKHEAEAAQHWSVRLADARKFLAAIGTDEEISKIMGGRYSDVEKALGGSHAFVASRTRRALETGGAMVGIE